MDGVRRMPESAHQDRFAAAPDRRVALLWRNECRGSRSAAGNFPQDGKARLAGRESLALPRDAEGRWNKRPKTGNESKACLTRRCNDPLPSANSFWPRTVSMRASEL